MTTFSFLAPGNFSVQDDGIAGNGVSSIYKDGVFIQNFAIPADEIVFRAAVPGITITFNLTESLGTADLRIETPPSSTQLPDAIVVRSVRTNGNVTLLAAGAITEGGSDAAADIIAGALVLSAVTGVGTPANAIETQTATLEAETDAGGINIANVGPLVVGGLSADVAGLDVATSGDIRLTNLGGITLSDETTVDSVHGGSTSGDVILTALGAESDISSSVDQSSILALGGDIVLTAGRDVAFGLAGANFNNDVRADGDVIVAAGRDFLLSGFADFFADGVSGTTGGSVVIGAGRDISLLNTTGTSAGLRSAGSGGGDVLLTTGAGGTFTHQTAGSNAIASFSGDVIVNADRMIIAGTSGITAFGSSVLRPVSAGREIVLGSLADAAVDALELSDAELDRIFGDNLVLGSTDTGRVRLGAPLSPGNIENLTLRSGTDILLEASLTLPGNLSLFAGDDIYLSSGTISAAAFLAFADQAGDDDGAGGTINIDAVVAATTATLTGNAENDTLTGTGEEETLLGLGGNDRLTGNDGADTLNGGTGVDILIGGLADDNYFVTNGDIVTEAAGEGFDEVFSSETYALPVGAEVELLATTNFALTTSLNLLGNELNNAVTGNNGANSLYGLGGSDTLRGLEGNDSLDGGANPDQLLGGLGNDTYYVTNGDVVTEAAGEGFDSVYAHETFTLAAGSAVELLATANFALTTPLNLVGNELNNAVTGNNGANSLFGQAGLDTLRGLAGNDSLDGGENIDQLIGGLGNDSFFVTAGDVVTEAAGEGFDSAYASESYTLNAGTSVEVLATANAALATALDLTGNNLNNAVTGNAGANIINGGGGNDTLRGLGGADRFDFTSAPGAGNVDLLPDFAPGIDEVALDDAAFAGLPAGALPASAFRTGAAAGDADDRIIYNPATGALFFDVDGTGGTAQVQFATLSAGLAVTAGDFVVI